MAPASLAVCTGQVARKERWSGGDEKGKLTLEAQSGVFSSQPLDFTLTLSSLQASTSPPQMVCYETHTRPSAQRSQGKGPTRTQGAVSPPLPRPTSPAWRSARPHSSCFENTWPTPAFEVNSNCFAFWDFHIWTSHIWAGFSPVVNPIQRPSHSVNPISAYFYMLVWSRK